VATPGPAVAARNRPSSKPRGWAACLKGPLPRTALLLGSLAAVGLAACRPARGSSAPAAPQRIVSLNPTTTELLFAIGAGDRLVGRSDACDYPAQAASVPSLGGGFPPTVEVVAGVKPDLVVLYQSAGNAAAAARLRDLGIKVIQLRTDRLADVSHAARVLGAAVGRFASGDSVAAELERALAAERVAAAADSSPTPALLLAWDQPVIALGAGSFVSELLELAGGRNIFADIAVPSAPVSLEAIADRDPAALLLVGSEMPSLERRAEWRALPAVRAGRVIRLTESASNRPSPRAPQAISALRARLAALTTDAPAGELQ
jgi:iron complex transport system substrate-binding protein